MRKWTKADGDSERSRGEPKTTFRGPLSLLVEWDT
jgi:hypothetical protein